jgi:Tfp pilus assembly protein PilV
VLNAGSFRVRWVSDPRHPKRRCRAFSLIEVCISIVLVALLFVGIYGAVASSMSIVKLCQENERATQILSGKLDTIRLYNWEQLTNRFVPVRFTERFDVLDTNSALFYTGSVSIVEAPVHSKYSSNVMEVSVELTWTSAKRPQSRIMSTYVAKYGLQKYIMR